MQLKKKRQRSFNKTYRIAENFRGRKLLQISRFCGYTRKFSPQNLGRGVLWRCKMSKNRIFTNSWKFSPSKVSCYTVYNFLVTLMQLRQPKNVVKVTQVFLPCGWHSYLSCNQMFEKRSTVLERRNTFLCHKCAWCSIVWSIMTVFNHNV